jgi:hypothetical protein
VAFALSEASSPTTTVTSGRHVVGTLRDARGEARDRRHRAHRCSRPALLLWSRPHKRAYPAAGPGVKRVAVLPFENLGSPEDDYFADGISDRCARS